MLDLGLDFIIICLLINIFLYNRIVKAGFLCLNFIFFGINYVCIRSFGNYDKFNLKDISKVWTWGSKHSLELCIALLFVCVILAIAYRYKLESLKSIKYCVEITEAKKNMFLAVSLFIILNTASYRFCAKLLTNWLNHVSQIHSINPIVFFLVLTTIVFFTIRKLWISIPLVAIIYGLSAAEILSHKIMGKCIDYLTISNLDLSMIEMSTSVAPELVRNTVLGFVACIIFYFIIDKGFKEKYSRNRMVIINCLVIVSCLGIIYNETFSAYGKVFNTFQAMYKYRNLTVNEIWAKIGSKEKFVGMDKAEVKVSKAKNIVIIYCESLESNFLDEKNFRLETKNLRELVNSNFNFYSNYKDIYGTGWTIGALYATQTGMPASFKSENGNKTFMSLSKSNIPSYASVLKKSGYNNVFINASSNRFAGTGNIMKVLGYDSIYGPENLKNKVTNWGGHDKDIFYFAKKQYAELSGKNKPFNLTMLTIDMHFPKGLPDASLKNKINKQIQYPSHEFAVASLDYLLKDFTDWIAKQPNGKDTIILVMGDHRMMGNTKVSPIVNKLNSKKGRSTFLMSNVPIRNFKKDQFIAYYDIPNIVLELTGVKTNATFSKNMIKNINPDIISKNKELFTVLNHKLNR